MIEREYETMAAVEDDHFWFVSMRAIVRDTFEVLGLPPTAIVLDVGCGTGGTMKALDGLGRFVGLDLSITAARFCSRRTKQPVLCGVAESLPLAEKSVDAVLALDVFEHIPDDSQAISEVRRVLAPKGYLVATVPCHPALFSEHDLALKHVRRYTKKGFLTMLERHGFEVIRATWTNMTLFPLIALVRLFSKMRKAQEPRSDASRRIGALNGVLKRIMMGERHLLRRVDLPFGLGILVVARCRS